MTLWMIAGDGKKPRDVTGTKDGNTACREYKKVAIIRMGTCLYVVFVQLGGDQNLSRKGTSRKADYGLQNKAWDQAQGDCCGVRSWKWRHLRHLT